MRRPLALVLIVAAAGAAPSAHARPLASAGPNPTFVITGHGWGHGVGMSQYGAYGYAQHGATFDQILAHYYSGTTLAQAPVSSIRVLLANKKKKLTLSSDVPFSVQDGTGTTHSLEAGRITFGPGLRLTVDGQAAAEALPPPLTFV